MAEHKILITTSGVGSRLGYLTDSTNKCLIRIADKPSISYIVESYPKDSNFVVTLGHFGDYVRQFLTIAYPDRKFAFVEIDNYEIELLIPGIGTKKEQKYDLAILHQLPDNRNTYNTEIQNILDSQ